MITDREQVVRHKGMQPGKTVAISADIYDDIAKGYILTCQSIPEDEGVSVISICRSGCAARFLSDGR
jgi:hypothetical protein